MRTAYKCRAYPSPEQAAVLNRTFGCVRKVWNEALEWRTKRYRAEGKTTSYAESDRYLTGLKKTKDLAFLSEVSSVPLQQTLRHQSTAFANFFAKRARYPRYKSREGKQSAAYTRSAFRMQDAELYVAKTPGALCFVWSWPDIDVASLHPTTVTLSRERDGMWYVSFAVGTDDPEPFAQTGDVVGIDLGIKDFAVTSDGQRIANPRHLERKRRNLARYERRKARTCRGSANRKKAARKVAVAHGKVRRAREDFLHKTSTELVRRYDTIVVEDLNVSGMVRNRSLARQISGCGWGTFRTYLEYKTARWGKRIVVIDRWHPSSKLCSTCGHLLARLSLSTRHGTCLDCGTLHDRDTNAAKNILAEGLSASACGADVRRTGTSRTRSAVKQEVPRSDPGRASGGRT
ncbi:RNA-guided endonuclease InsQ/TnpB family protein [Streptomyces oceani]|uniref:Transposase n=1 Tax=Streptomyces oceani TaxID=1075402 RepID=A0A1E7JXS5_9ACTN|nr:RNA-guided endonuclease TnpB family protein [Streptomyces oceani]OEU96470.1 transposase [Streptomyces oceani]